MSECKLDAWSPDNVDTFLNMPRGPERDEALRKAQQLRYAGEAYNYLFSKELAVDHPERFVWSVLTVTHFTVI